jgi:hypothetical protein
MLAPFFQTAMISPTRRGSFRRAVIGHLFFLAGLTVALESYPSTVTLTMIGHALLGAGIVEGAVLCGWRLTQLPKSQALEFLLTSPIQPGRLFLAEALVGLARLALLTLSGLPLFVLMLFSGMIEVYDFVPLLLMPFLCGAVCGIGITVWTYEPKWVRRVGEIFSLLGILVYLVVGVLAGEKLKEWLQELPSGLGQSLFDLFQGFHNYNPFGILQYWLNPQRENFLAVERLEAFFVVTSLLLVLLSLRGMVRLKGHFADRHYQPISSDRVDQSSQIGDQPLSWWAVRRVMEYSGRVNLYLAGGFSVVYSAYLIAGDQWPAWMGQLVFQIFERLGGAPMLVTGMILLAAVPAAFQYGLWDPSPQDRCRRLELLLLTDLNARDYWHAALSAAWKRGRGYFVIAGILWFAMLYSGRMTPLQWIACIAASMILWNFAFIVGFHAFSTGKQANGLGSLLTLGTPIVATFSLKLGYPLLASLMPPGAVYLAMTEPPGLTWACGPLLIGGYSLRLLRRSLASCDAQLRAWYDRNHGAKLLD